MRKALVVLAVVIAAALAWTVWPTPWRYSNSASSLFRIARTSNRVDVLCGDGWHTLTPAHPLADLADGATAVTASDPCTRGLVR